MLANQASWFDFHQKCGKVFENLHFFCIFTEEKPIDFMIEKMIPQPPWLSLLSDRLSQKYLYIQTDKIDRYPLERGFSPLYGPMPDGRVIPSQLTCGLQTFILKEKNCCYTKREKLQSFCRHTGIESIMGYLKTDIPLEQTSYRVLGNTVNILFMTVNYIYKKLGEIFQPLLKNSVGCVRGDTSH